MLAWDSKPLTEQELEIAYNEWLLEMRQSEIAHAHVDEPQELHLLDQPWSWRGTVKMLSILTLAVLSGFFFLGLLTAAKWVLIHMFGVNL